MLSGEETVDLMVDIFRRVINSRDMTRMMLESEEFNNLVSTLSREGYK